MNITCVFNLLSEKILKEQSLTSGSDLGRNSVGSINSLCTLGHNISCQVMTITGTLCAGPEELLGRGGAGEELLR